MGMGLLEGEKMSSSKGHVVLPGEAIDEYGADTVRFFLLNSAEPWQDYDWREEQVASTRDDLARFYERAADIADGPEGERDLQRVDRWLLAKLQDTVATVTEAMDSFETRTASQAAFYDFREHLRWYRQRTDLDRRRTSSDEDKATGLDRPGARWTLRRVLETRLRLLAPFVPFLANDLHERLTGEPAEDAAWPSVDEAFVDDRVVVEEGLVEDLRADVREVVDVTGTDPERIEVYVAADWKREVFDAVRDVGTDRGQVMSEVMSDPDLRERGDAVNDLVGDLIELARERTDDQLDTLAAVDEAAVYADAADFLEAEFDAEVVVAGEDDADDPERADAAAPFRPAIHLD
jgi:leucyl-tRNA synthetase